MRALIKAIALRQEDSYAQSLDRLSDAKGLCHARLLRVTRRILRRKHPMGASFLIWKGRRIAPPLPYYVTTTLALTHFRNSLKAPLSPKVKRCCTYSTIIAAGKSGKAKLFSIGLYSPFSRARNSKL